MDARLCNLLEVLGLESSVDIECNLEVETTQYQTEQQTTEHVNIDVDMYLNESSTHAGIIQEEKDKALEKEIDSYIEQREEVKTVHSNETLHDNSMCENVEEYVVEFETVGAKPVYHNKELLIDRMLEMGFIVDNRRPQNTSLFDFRYENDDSIVQSLNVCDLVLTSLEGFDSEYDEFKKSGTKSRLKSTGTCDSFPLPKKSIFSKLLKPKER